MSDERDTRPDFEALITASPYERDVTRFRHSDGKTAAWPGQYQDYAVQLAWECWCAALKLLKQEAER